MSFTPNPANVKVVQCSSAHNVWDPRIFHKHCLTLAQAGYEVVEITPDYHTYTAAERTIHGVRVRALRPPTSRSARMLLSPCQIYRECVRQRADIYHFHDPELIAVGLLLKLQGKIVIYDVHEDLPLTIATKPWVPSRLRSPVESLCRLMERVAGYALDAIVAATPGIARNFPCEKTITVQNFPEPLAVARDDYLERQPLIVYVGIMSEERGLRELLDAVALLPASLGARLVLAGYFEHSSFEAEMRRHPTWSAVEYHQWLRREDIVSLLNRARIGVVTLRPCANFLESQPLKLFEYMVAGLPVVASDFPLWREIVGGNRCGYLVDPLVPRQIADALRQLLENPATAAQMGNHGQQAALRSYNWKLEADKLLDLYARLLARGPSALADRTRAAETTQVDAA